jgi:uncharacterized protein (DUF924 family)
VLFDQFPRNMFRGHADQFATTTSLCHRQGGG